MQVERMAAEMIDREAIRDVVMRYAARSATTGAASTR